MGHRLRAAGAAGVRLDMQLLYGKCWHTPLLVVFHAGVSLKVLLVS